MRLITYIADNYVKCKKIIEIATKGNYSDDFYHYLILKISKKEADSPENYLFKYANKEYFMANSEWNRSQSKEITEELIYEKNETTNEQILNRYLHTFDNEVDEVNKKIVLLYLSCSNENELHKKYKINYKTLKNAIEYVRTNIQQYSISNVHDGNE